MSKDDFDIFRQLAKSPKDTTASDFIGGLQNREVGGYRQNVTSRENLHVFAEEQFVIKEKLNEMRCEMPGSPRSTFLMVFSPDGRRVASTHGNHNIYVTDLRSGKNIKTLVGHPRTPWCIAFHPTSDQIVASGCLGGQVRIWDLNGGSEVWTTSSQSVIASIAFHPNDRILVIATVNEIYFWDWSQPEPFVQTSTNNPKEKVRYVAFDKLGHKLITGIANSSQTRWERVRAPVPVPRQERCANPYRRTITQRLVTSAGNAPIPQPAMSVETTSQERDNSSIPERERRITMCYRNLVREYERLVHRYLQLYRPPTMIDRGTDPMEPSHFNSGTQTAGTSERDPSLPGPSGLQAIGISEAGTSSMASGTREEGAVSPSTGEPSSAPHSQCLITPSRIFSVARKPPSSIRGTQTNESGKHKSEESADLKRNDEKRFKRNDGESASSDSSTSRETSPQISQPPQTDASTEVSAMSNAEDQRVLVVSLERLSPERVSSTSQESGRPEAVSPSTQKSRLFKRRATLLNTLSSGPPPGINYDNVRPPGNPHASGPPGNRYGERFAEYIRANRERIQEFRRRNQSVLNTEGSSEVTSHENTDGDGTGPSSSTDHDTVRMELLRYHELSNWLYESCPGTNIRNNQQNVDDLLSSIRRTAEEEVRNRILPIIRSVPPPDRPELIRLFENSREHVRTRFRQMCPVFLRRHCRRPLRIESSTDSSSSDNDATRQSPTRLNRRNSDIDHSQGTGRSPVDPFLASDSPASPPVNSAHSSTSLSSPAAPASGERNYRAELDQLVSSLLTEIEWNDESRNSPSGSAGNGNNSSNATSARTRPTRSHLWSMNAERLPQPPGESIENMLFDSPTSSQREQLREDYPYRRFSGPQNPTHGHMLTSPYYSLSPPIGDPRTFPNTDTRTTNSTIYTSSSSSPSRRRVFSHRVSAFMPTRVNYTRTRFRRNPHYASGTGRTGFSRPPRSPSLVLDELINYAERENSEEDLPPPSPQGVLHFESAPRSSNLSPENSVIGSMYSNIMQDLESSLIDVRNIRASSRLGESSDMLNNFSERLENIMSQSDSILRNLRSSIDLLPNPPEQGRNSGSDSDPRWNFNDPGFYVRDLRTEWDLQASNDSDSVSPVNPDVMSLHAVTADHTYPRNPNNSETNESMSPLMNSLHLTISHIQRQARLLRRQVQSIERIDRAMVEVSQLQLMRQLIIEMVRHGNLLGESRSTGVSSVRQMMAGTRISDSSPYESPSEEAVPNSDPPEEQSQAGTAAGPSQPSTSSSTTSSNDQPGPSSGVSGQHRRTTNRKTYPPSRYVRNYPRRPAFWFSKRCLYRVERGPRQNSQSRSGSRSNTPTPYTVGPQIFNYSNINPSTLSLMTRRLERLLTEQMRIFTRSQDSSSTSSPRPSASVDLGEHILALRLHGCLLRINRVLGNRVSSILRNTRTSYSQVGSTTASYDGASRYAARHTLSLIVDGLSRYIEELGPGPISNSMRMQIHSVFAMSLLLTELLLLQVVDSIPPPSGMNLDPERESLARRIDELCTQMLQNRVTGSSAQLTRSLRLMRLTMRHAHRALDQTYIARRNAMLPRQEPDRRQLLGTINRCLRTINRSHSRNSHSNLSEQSSDNAPNQPSASGNGEPFTESFYSTIHDLITRYSDNREEEGRSQPSTSRERPQHRNPVSSNNDNSDVDDTDDPEEPDWFVHRSNTSNNGNPTRANSLLYRTNNVNLASTSRPEPSTSRVWNVPSVQVNDVPVTEPFAFAQRLMAHRQRFSERVSELRTNSRVGLFRPRFLHPLYASVNPFDENLDEPQREQIYDSDMVTTVTPNHRIQAWDISDWTVPAISNSMKNVVVSECKIHNDASVDIATDGTILVTLLPSGGYLNFTNRLGVYSLRWETLGQCLYTTSFEQNAVSVSLSPLSRHLVVGFVTRRVSIIISDRLMMARIYRIEQKDVPGDRLPVLREFEQHRENRINCIRWLPTSGQGLIYATNTGQLVILS
ncbi:uncharacterized protein [Euwallacea fornicatus]|uniref:uncharacterized protein isoform X1 n=1 Tax=Euwallacea fornicatus TaxID=995702 RepID=UPI0033905892